MTAQNKNDLWQHCGRLAFHKQNRKTTTPPRHHHDTTTTMTLAEAITELQRLEPLATPQPWNLNWGCILANGISTTVAQIAEDEDFMGDKWQNDRALIALLRNVIVPLLAEREAMRGALEQGNRQLSAMFSRFAEELPQTQYKAVLDAIGAMTAALDLANQPLP